MIPTQIVSVTAQLDDKLVKHLFGMFAPTSVLGLPLERAASLAGVSRKRKAAGGRKDIPNYFSDFGKMHDPDHREAMARRARPAKTST